MTFMGRNWRTSRYYLVLGLAVLLVCAVSVGWAFQRPTPAEAPVIPPPFDSPARITRPGATQYEATRTSIIPASTATSSPAGAA